ncbi:MAG: filamentous hemagglutinin N-terminal domain-containing protein, partial [Fusobacterium polymorphum]
MRNKFFRKFITIIFLLIYNIEIFAANLVVDPNSNHNTKLDVAPNGVPVVNISTPNDKGISINEFSEYNIDERGQVLNNADNYGRSHLAGIISANPNLAPNQAANLIILQVNGSNHSQIEGYLEALSRQKVDVILSNENGLYINNGGTINIKNFTATTGRVNLKDGDFVGIDVEKGNIVIGPKGMDGSNANYVELIAKTLELRGNIVTNDLKVVAGSNKEVPEGTVAIDGRELGGMYAGVIKIISTDKGAGVNSDAFIVSKNSKLEITADGKIKVNKVQGKGIDIKGKEYEQKDLAYSDEGISINADKIKLDGTGTQAERQINLNGTVENNATIYTKEGLKTKDLTNTGIVQAINKIEVEGNLTNKGDIQTLDNISIKENALNKGNILTNGFFTSKDLKNEKILSVKNDITINKLENNGKIVTGKNLDISKSLENSGRIEATGNILISENANNTGDILTNGSFLAKDTKTTKSLIAKEGITVNNLESSGIVATNKELNINGNLKNNGNIQAIDKINILGNALNTGEILTNGKFTAKDINSKKLVALKGISVNNLKNDEIIATNENLDIAGNFENKGKVSTNKSLNIA